MNEDLATVRVHDAMLALAFVGDLSMGQPCDHSRRVAALARRLARALGRAELAADAGSVALLRWSGCTANAGEVAALLGDDVAGRAKMLAEPALLAQLQQTALGDPAQRERLAAFAGVAQIHCEVAGDIARRLGLPAAVDQALRHVFDGYDLDGGGTAASELVAIVTLCGEFEIAARLHGAEAAPTACARHPRALVEALCAHGGDWLAAVETADDGAPIASDAAVPLTLLGDVIDLKLPWLTGHSRAVAVAVDGAAARLGLDAAARRRACAAALLHGIGRAALPNALWNKVLRCVAHGASNKEAAQRLGLRPSTVRTHLEHVFEKLECSSRAAATLKAAALGLL